MSVQGVSSSNNLPTNMLTSQPKNAVSSGASSSKHTHEEKAPTQVKIGVFATTLIGVVTAMAMVFKGKGKDYAFKNPKDFIDNLRKIKYEEEEMAPLVGKLAIGSVGGGLIGGALFDKKENLKAKIRESVIQLVGNIATPLACVIAGNKLFDKYAEPKLPEKLKSLKTMGKAPKILVGLACLIAGILSGNKIGNYINKTIFNCDDKRTLKLTDMSPHIDDVATASTFAIPGDNPIGTFLQRIIPAALMISGYSVGVAQENPDRLHYKNHSETSSDNQKTNV